jgi:hypothetical protein
VLDHPDQLAARDPESFHMFLETAIDAWKEPRGVHFGLVVLLDDPSVVAGIPILSKVSVLRVDSAGVGSTRQGIEA